eukprot:59374_1
MFQTQLNSSCMRSMESTIPIDRDERHPSIPDTRGIAGIDNDTLSNIINSIIQSKTILNTNHHPTQGTTQYLLPVDLVVSVDNKSNKPTVQAALPSSFALQMPTITPLLSTAQLPPTPMSSLSSISSTIPSLHLCPPSLQPSTLNPSAPSFLPSIPYTPIQPILEQCDDATEEEDDQQSFVLVEQEEAEAPSRNAWCVLDEMDNEEPVATRCIEPIPHVFNPPPRYFLRNSNSTSDKREYNKNWRNRNKCNAKTTSWRNMSHKPKYPCSKPIKLMAEFVKHVTLPNREEYLPSKIYTKTWAMRNGGNVEWGYNVELVYCKGDPHLSLYDRYPVINAQPGQEVEISATIKTSSVPKRYCTYFRLQKNGRFFGPRVWVDIIVGTLDQIKQCGAQNHTHDKVLPPRLRAIKWKKKYGTQRVVPVSCQ